MKQSLTRSSTDKLIGGVAGGVARAFGWDASIVRIIWVVAAIAAQFPWAIYLVLWLVLPLEEGGPSGFDEVKKVFTSKPPSDLR